LRILRRAARAWHQGKDLPTEGKIQHEYFVSMLLQESMNANDISTGFWLQHDRERTLERASIWRRLLFLSGYLVVKVMQTMDWCGCVGQWWSSVNRKCRLKFWFSLLSLGASIVLLSLNRYRWSSSCLVKMTSKRDREIRHFVSVAMITSPVGCNRDCKWIQNAPNRLG
jgi:hypothetical protein